MNFTFEYWNALVFHWVSSYLQRVLTEARMVVRRYVQLLSSHSVPHGEQWDR